MVEPGGIAMKGEIQICEVVKDKFLVLRKSGVYEDELEVVKVGFLVERNVSGASWSKE